MADDLGLSLPYALQGLDNLLSARKAERLAAEQRAAQQAEREQQFQLNQQRQQLELQKFQADQEDRAANRAAKDRADVAGVLQTFTPTEALPNEVQQAAN